MSIYQQITNQIIEELEKGAAPWVKPWRADATADKNVITGAAYRGINRLLLGMSSMAKGYNSAEWGTYKQWQEKGYQVNKGEKSTHIVFFKNVAGKEKNEEGESEGGYALIKSYAVFNASQTNKEIEEVTATPDVEFYFAGAEERMIKTGAIISHGGDAAFFMPSQDRIQLPNKAAFDTPASYYATAFHELTHWTGAERRLDRNLSAGRFGNPAYAFEELVAEIGAAYLCADYGIQGEMRHAGYIQSWLTACREDEKAIFKAAALAQKSADYINELDATAHSLAA